MWKKKVEKIEERKKEKEEILLDELCGGDAELNDCLSSCLFLHPLDAISIKDLDILIAEGEKSGDFGPAMDKAIFEGSQNLGEKERYLKVIQAVEPSPILIKLVSVSIPISPARSFGFAEIQFAAVS